MVKKKTHDDLEILRGINRNLTKQIKKLQKQLSRKEKREYLFDQSLEQEAEVQLEEEIKENLTIIKNKCPQCKIGKIETTEIGNRILVTCSNCKYRTSKKIT